MVAYDVQAHPFNRAPNANPQTTASRSAYVARSDTEATGGSSRSSVWSVEMEQGSCGCLSAYVGIDGTDDRIWLVCFGKERVRDDTPSDG